MMEIGSEKLDATSQMLDTVEGYSQQLALAEKEMVSCRTRDELTGGTRNTSSTITAHTQHKTTTHTASLPGWKIIINYVLMYMYACTCTLYTDIHVYFYSFARSSWKKEKWT